MINNTIQRELHLPQPREQVWEAIANRDALADWMYPNDFEPRVGHPFTFQVPPKPEVGFEGLIVRCEVLECEPPGWLMFSWSVAGPVENTRVSFRLESEGDGTRLLFEHAGFDLSQPGGKQAFGGAQYGWAMMLEKLTTVLSNQGNQP
ncbi:SRPBCC family protein [Luteolibacter soli]|uniref:SRPBCC domain-containing protein n=1 Tax=Luteolibacter soli TaxID=3135280 RepID=A0ABU9AVT8_9BACT